jgi:glycosyltransferase involved in cell wall biosynthesis
MSECKSVYVTDSYIESCGSGGGVVGFHELNALKQVSEVTQVYQRVGKLFFEDFYPRNPFMYDYFIASILKDPEKVDLAHFYGASFNLTSKLLCKARKFATVPAHNLEESLREWGTFEYWSPPPPHLTDDSLFRFLCHGLHEVTVITPSKSSANYLKNKHGLDSVIIPHGTDIPSTYNTEHKEFNVLHISAFGPDKGQKYLVKAWEHLQNLPMTLTMCCPNIPESFVAGLQNLKLCSNISEDEKADLYRNASVYVQPSVSEGWGLCVAESMSYGTPVIVTEGAGASDMVTDGVDGFIVPIRDEQAIIDKTTYFFDNPSEVKRMGENARVKSLNYSWGKIEKKYMELFTR